MTVYVIALVAVAAMLYVSFRALAMPPAGAAEGAALLERLLEAVTAEVQEVAAALTRVGVAAPTAGEDAPAVTARAARRRLAGCEQQMSRWGEQDAPPRVLETRDLLVAAVEDLGWACRMVESAGYRQNPALAEAVTQLSGHARRCASGAAQLLAQRERK